MYYGILGILSFSLNPLLFVACFDKVEGIKNNEIADAIAIVESSIAGKEILPQ